MRHVVVMTGTATLGLMAIFVVDLANLFYISLLGEAVLAAAIGYAGTVMFFNTALCIGVMIAATAVVSKAIGSGDKERARRLAGSSLVFVIVFAAFASALTLFLLEPLIALLGATGETAAIAKRFLTIVIPSMPLLGLGLCLSGLMRAIGDARRAMYVTLMGGLASAILDPLLIFGFDLGVDGAAIATVLSRFALIAAGWYGAVRFHDLVARPHFAWLAADFRALAVIAVPAVLTNVATPIGNAYMTATLSSFGDDVVAGWAVIGRVIPIAFGAIFAVSGAVGPILGQNLGAKRLDRVRRTLIDAMIFITIYTLVIWGMLILLQGLIVSAFSATGEMEALIRFFCLAVAATWLFNGMLFVANAAFNNLGYPILSTVFNWGRATLGTIPFVAIGAWYGGAEGALLGQGLGGVLFGLAAILCCFFVVGRMRPEPPDHPSSPPWHPPLSAFSSGKSANLG
ncbi:MAG: MATE family efflux transporter [Pseudomonadota bacterium]